MANLKLLLLLLVFNFNQCIGQKTDSTLLNNYIEKADSLFRTFKFDSASVYYCKAAALYEREQHWLSCVKNYRLTSNALLKAAKYDTALYYAHKTLDIAENRFQENKEEMFEKSDVLINMADVLEKKGNYKEELALCKKAMELTLKTDSLASLRIAAILNKTGVAYTNLGDHISAFQYCDSALHIRIRLLGEGHVDVAESELSMGKVCLDRGEYNKALENYQKALKIYLNNLGEHNLAAALSYNNIGIAYYYKGEYEKAWEYYQKALKVRIAVMGEQHSIVASSYNNVGIIYYIKGEYDKALEYYLKALKINIMTLGEWHPAVASNYGNIGGVYIKKEEYDKGLKYHQKAINIYIATLGKEHPLVAYGFNNIGVAYENNREYDKALEYLQKALKIYIAARGQQNMNIAYIYNDIGTVYYLKGDYNKAIDYYQKSLKILITTQGEQQTSVANGCCNIGMGYHRKKENDIALEYHQKALNIYIAILGEKHPDVASCYNYIGEINNEKGEFIKAFQNYQKALVSNLISFNDSSIYSNPKLENVLSKAVLLETLIGKANTFYRLYKNKTHSLSDIKASLSNYEIAFQLINKIRNEYNTESTKLLLSEKVKIYYAEATEVALEYIKTNPSEKHDAKAFEFIEKGKSAALAAKYNELKAEHIAAIPDSLMEAEKECESNINFYSNEIVKEKYKKGGYDTLKVNLFENKHFNYSRKLDSLISYLETTYPEYYKFKYDNNIATVSDIQQSVDKNTAVINYLVGDSSLFIAAITNDTYKTEEIKIDSSFNKLVFGYYKSIKMAEPEFFLKNSAKLYEKLINPIRGIINNKERLVIIPDDYLYYVPFETLISNDSQKIQNQNYSQLDYLIKSHSISYHHSATLWYNTLKRSESSTKQKINFIGFAPVFSKEKNNGMILSSKISAIDTTDHNLAYRTICYDLKRFNPLPYSKDEVTSIVHLFEKRNKEARAYLYSEASESNFKANINKYNIVHVSSHGFANDKEPDLSGIVFSQPTDSTSKEDGILYTGETYNLNLSADLVVLSSCESGLGKLINGEGLQALSRGFLYAGTPNVVFSLWKALDEPTMNLMIKFYSNILDGKSYPEALRQAKLNLIKNPATAFPHFWGGFVLVGR